MINAGISILGFEGFQYFDGDRKAWCGISSIINYPTGQDMVKNPPEQGDVVIEPGGNVWEVIGVAVVSDTPNKVRLDMVLTSGEPLEETSPGMGTVSRGGIVTPVNGFIAPHWDLTLVDAGVGRIAAMATMANMTDMWTGEVDLGYVVP